MEEVARAICVDRGLAFVKKVGRGSFKETFLVQDSNGHDQALKVFFADFSPERTERELQAMLKCSHPGIGKLEDVSTIHHGGATHLYIVEEYLGGGTLSSRISKSLLPLDQVIVLGRSLVDAVGHMASKGLVHRDLKPDNIMFRNDGAAVIVDFGLVRDLGRPSLTKTWLTTGPGTPYYAAPEQLNNDKDLIDWRTDQFGLGTVLALCAYGIHPYAQNGDKPDAVVGRVSARESPSSEFVAWARDSGLELLPKMVRPWPVERYRTPDALKRAWEEAH